MKFQELIKDIVNLCCAKFDSNILENNKDMHKNPMVAYHQSHCDPNTVCSNLSHFLVNLQLKKLDQLS